MKAKKSKNVTTGEDLKEAKIKRFTEMFEEFRLKAIEETGYAVAANVNYSPTQGLFPVLSIMETKLEEKKETKSK